MRKFAFCSATLLALLLAGQAQAAAIVNNDAIPHQFTVKEFARTHVMHVDAGHKKHLCMKGCDLTYGKKTWTLARNDHLTFTRGKVAYQSR
ncbi:MAG: hypothetical protein AB7S41_04845 [Parvibaculaceae bacterium]